MSDSLKFNTGYRYNDSYSKKEFYDKALMYLRDAYLCPAYIFDEATFSDVNKIDIPIITAEGSAQVNYTRLLGYDKQVAYTTKKTTKYSDGTRQNSYSTSYKTETDWVRDSGSIEGVSKETFIDPKYVDYINSLNLDSNSIIPLSNDELKTLKVDSDVLELLKNGIIKNVFLNGITYPVNKVKKEEYQGECFINALSCTFISIYALEVNVRGKSFVLYACSNTKPDILRLGDLPINDDQEEYNDKIYSISSERDKITKLPRTIRLLTIILLSALFLTLLIIGINKNILALKIVSFIPIILEIIIVIILNKRIRKVVLEYGTKMNEITEHREKTIEENRIEAYNDFISEKEKRVQ